MHKDPLIIESIRHKGLLGFSLYYLFGYYYALVDSPTKKLLYSFSRQFGQKILVKGLRLNKLRQILDPLRGSSTGVSIGSVHVLIFYDSKTSI